MLASVLLTTGLLVPEQMAAKEGRFMAQTVSGSIDAP
jgi:hypothetical protein